MSSVNGLGGVGPVNVQSMDLETAMMAVQTGRSLALEDQLKAQIAQVQGKNDQIASMNEAMGAKRTRLAQAEAAVPANEAKIAELTAMRDQLAQVKGRDPNGWTGLSWGWAGDDRGKSQEMLSRVRAEGLTDRGPAPTDVDRNGTMDAHGSTVGGWIDQLNAKIDGLKQQNANLKQEQADIKVAIDGMKSSIDALSNSQQMDMLRLQSLSNKRNEAFETMTNFIKKMQDNRSSIVGNMR